MYADNIFITFTKFLEFIINFQNQYSNNIVNVKYFHSENVLLMKKYDTNMFYTNEFFNEHNLQEFVNFDNFVVYKTTYGNYKKYMHTLDTLFVMENDMDIFLQLPPQKSNIYDYSSNEWFLNRVVNRENVNDEFSKYTCLNEQNIVTYVVDTGIDIKHPEFEGRATWGMNFADEEDTDCNMHGTHVAGLIGSKTFGVCKNANLVAVKVLNCEGSGSYSGVIKGLEWVYKTHKNNNNKQKSVINMSLGGGKSNVIDAIIQKLVDTESMYVVVAAGNENSDSCNTSPAGVMDAITVMASDISDSRAYFSNWGECTDIYSPGVNILSTIPNKRTRLLSGTSMASPIVAGVLNHYIENYPFYNMKQLKELMLQNSTKNVIKKNRDSNNYLIYLGQ